MPSDIRLTAEQVDAIRSILRNANNLQTDERQLLNGLLEMAQKHPAAEGGEAAWRFIIPQLSKGN
jgi:hypothetical protein